jgi:hypothetical protein
VSGDPKRALIGVLDDLSGAAASAAEVGASSPILEAPLNQLRKLELDLFEEITRIEEASLDQSEVPDSAPAADRTDIACCSGTGMPIGCSLI